MSSAECPPCWRLPAPERDGAAADRLPGSREQVEPIQHGDGTRFITPRLMEIRAIRCRKLVEPLLRRSWRRAGRHDAGPPTVDSDTSPTKEATMTLHHLPDDLRDDANAACSAPRPGTVRPPRPAPAVRRGRHPGARTPSAHARPCRCPPVRRGQRRLRSPLRALHRRRARHAEREGRLLRLSERHANWWKGAPRGSPLRRQQPVSRRGRALAAAGLPGAT